MKHIQLKKTCLDISDTNNWVLCFYFLFSKARIGYGRDIPLYLDTDGIHTNYGGCENYIYFSRFLGFCAGLQ